jgi:hypothetical protein
LLFEFQECMRKFCWQFKCTAHRISKHSSQAKSLDRMFGKCFITEVPESQQALILTSCAVLRKDQMSPVGQASCEKLTVRQLGHVSETAPRDNSTTPLWARFPIALHLVGSPKISTTGIKDSFAGMNIRAAPTKTSYGSRWVV